MKKNNLDGLIEFDLINHARMMSGMSDEELTREAGRCLDFLERFYDGQDRFPGYLNPARGKELINDLVEDGGFGGAILRALEIKRDDSDRLDNILKVALLRHYAENIEE